MRQRSPLFPIFLIVLVDVFGFTIVIPLLAYYAEHFGASPLVATTLVSVYAGCSLFSTPLIGRLSDKHGRRKLLLLSQAGTLAGFIVLGNATALWMVFVGRILDGITAGNLSVAQAYISDHTAPQDRAKAFGVIGIAFGIGFMFGPGLGGWLAQYGMHWPFLAAACLSALSIICTFTLLTDELPPGHVKPDVTAAPAGRRPGLFDIAVYTEYFRRPGLAAIYLQFFLYIFAFSTFTSGFALFAERRFTHDGRPWSASEVGYLFMFSGFLGIMWQGGLIGRLVKRFGEVRLVFAGFVGAVIAYIMMGLAETVTMIVLTAVMASFGNGVLRPVLTSRISQAVGRHETGVALGISGSLSSLAMTMAPPVGGALLDHHWLVAWAFIPATASALGLIAALLSRPAPAVAALQSKA